MNTITIIIMKMKELMRYFADEFSITTIVLCRSGSRAILEKPCTDETSQTAKAVL